MFGFRSSKTKDRPVRWGRYHEISQARCKDVDRDSDHHDDNDAGRDGGLKSWLRPQVLALLMTANMLLSITTLLLWISRTKGTCTTTTIKTTSTNTTRQYPESQVHLLGQAQIPVSMERFRFQTGVRKQYTAFFGPPNATTDAAWAGLLNAGLVRIPKSQADQLSAPTAWSRRDPTMYVGIVEAFHQLHCLYHLRTVIYAPDELSKNPGHADHCIEYLRQTLTCLADVEIGPIGWDRQVGSYAVRDDPVRECRAFDKIHEWALDPERHEPEFV